MNKHIIRGLERTDDEVLYVIALNKERIEWCISGMEWEIDQCDCGRPGDKVWVAEFQGLIDEMSAIIGKEVERDH